MIPPPVIPPALAAMAAYPQWICWRLVQRPGKPKPDKVPTDPQTRHNIDPHIPSNWMDSATAVAAATAAGLGIGFVFTENDPFAFLDIDECATPQGPRPWADHAYQLISLLPGAAIETSCSGRGLHAFGCCARGLIHGKKNLDLHIELYTTKRFVALGTGATGDASTDCAAGFQTLATTYFPPGADLTGEWTTESQPGSGIADDDALIRKALASQSAKAVFGGKASFQDLWEANDLTLGATYPHPDQAYDASSADMALAAHLTFWTGGNCDQMLRLMWKSALARSKWEHRDDYLPNTIMKAVAGMRDVYRGRALKADVKAQEQALIAEAMAASSPPPVPTPPMDFATASMLLGGPAANAPPAAPPAPVPVVVPPATAPSTAAPIGVDEVTVIDGYPYCPPEAVFEMFKDYVYVLSVHKVMTPEGVLITGDGQFKTLFGHYQFALDHTGKDHTTNAWKAYYQSKCWTFRRANGLCFEPLNYNLTVKRGRETLANTWRDPEPPRKKGDPSRFVRHVQKMLPNGDDAERLLSYMAACVQHQGTKFTWCPLIQGVQGNGKSMVSEALMHAIGEKYVHIMKGVSVNAQFNGWMQDRVLVVVEDIHMGGSESAVEIIKPLITARRIQVERKGFDQTTENVCCNFIITTNHQDAIPLDPNERRWGMFFCAQQTKADMLAQGMTRQYFESLWNWLREEGFAIVADYLWNYVIPDEMNPAIGCMVAPETTTHQEAVEASRSAEAQYIAAAIAAEDPGFMDGWVSSRKAMALLRENHCKVAPLKLAKILTRMGYVKHPGLTKGRSPRQVAIEGGRPTLWIEPGHPSAIITGAEVVDTYEKAQKYPAAVKPSRL